MSNKKATVEEVIEAIERELPPVVYRNWHRWRDIVPISSRSVANDDSAGTGPKQKVYLGRYAGYPKAAFLEYLRGKIRV